MNAPYDVKRKCLKEESVFSPSWFVFILSLQVWEKTLWRCCGCRKTKKKPKKKTCLKIWRKYFKVLLKSHISLNWIRPNTRQHIFDIFYYEFPNLSLFHVRNIMLLILTLNRSIFTFWGEEKQTEVKISKPLETQAKQWTEQRCFVSWTSLFKTLSKKFQFPK